MKSYTEIAHSIFQLAPKNEIWHTPIKGLTLHAADCSAEFSGYVQTPSLCVVLLGERQICTNGLCQRFGNQEMMFCPVNLPITTQVIEVQDNQPYLALSLELDFELIAHIIGQLPPEKVSEPQDHRHKWALQQEIEDCLMRLLDLLYFPNRVPFLAPLLLQELYFYLLQSAQGDYLRSLLSQDSNITKIAKATKWLEARFAENVNMGELAKLVGMSVAGFYAHFKAVTTLTPLQYQKSLRLNAARTQLLAGKCVSETAYNVGYESSNQFSREYKQHFGISPRETKILFSIDES